MKTLRKKLCTIAMRSPEIILPFLTPGRIVSIFRSIEDSKLNNNEIWSYGVIINLRQRYNSLDGLVVDVLLPCRLVSGLKTPSPPSVILNGVKRVFSKSTKFLIVTFPLEMIKDISQLRLYLFDHLDLDNDDGRSTLFNKLEKCLAKYQSVPPIIDFFDPIIYSFLFQSSSIYDLSVYNRIADCSLSKLPIIFENNYHVNNTDLLNILVQVSDLSKQINNIPIKCCHIKFLNWVNLLGIKKDLSAELLNLNNKKIILSSQFNFEKEFKIRFQILQTLEHITSEGIFM